jgi:hypothetical protein
MIQKGSQKMIKYHSGGVYLKNGTLIKKQDTDSAFPRPEEAREGTIAYRIMRMHNKSDKPAKCALNSTR